MRVVTMRALTRTVLAMLLSAYLAASAAAATVAERHLVAHEASAALRNASHDDKLRITVWYPAAPGSVEAPLDVGPPGKPLFTPGSAAPDAAFEDARPCPTILLSHGFGGTPRLMGCSEEHLCPGIAMWWSPSTIRATMAATDDARWSGSLLGAAGRP